MEGARATATLRRVFPLECRAMRATLCLLAMWAAAGAAVADDLSVLDDEFEARDALGAWTLFHEAYGSDDRMHVFAAPSELTDADIVCGEGRQIVFVEPQAARRLDLTASASIVVPAFLDSELYASMNA